MHMEEDVEKESITANEIIYLMPTEYLSAPASIINESIFHCTYHNTSLAKK